MSDLETVCETLFWMQSSFPKKFIESHLPGRDLSFYPSDPPSRQLAYQRRDHAALAFRRTGVSYAEVGRKFKISAGRARDICRQAEYEEEGKPVSLATILAYKVHAASDAEWQAQRKIAAHDRVLESSILRAARLVAARDRATHTEEEWDALLAEFDGLCVRCGGSERIEKDHIVPIYQDGSDGIENLQPLCKSCNVAKGPDDFNWVAFRRSQRAPAIELNLFS